ncbi:unnamed protein product [Caenorhabditis auriculariae]|uniref:ShKT domain-containing protein n=1 Tax=Caenorhabditis auriculariae TaxID=2777116 RepID=A0A8S1HEA6_9PELO|nr:unnamed protein product [Caenorhabditis auriculariae]
MNTQTVNRTTNPILSIAISLLMSSKLIFSILVVSVLRTTAEEKPCRNAPGVPCVHLKEFCHAPGYVDYLKEYCAPFCGHCIPPLEMRTKETNSIL